MAKFSMNEYLRRDFMPTIWCAGCGNGIILGAVVRAIHELGWSRDDTVLISGIGCSARSPAYVDFNSMQTTHGRALAFATGVKAYNPRLNVVCLLGDGDCAAIGGNHLLHAARRNIDITAVVFNNSVYGMTGGQTSPTTPYRRYSTTAPFGNPEPELDICAVAASAGATYVARSTVYHVTQLKNLIKKALQHKGFSLVEALTPCPTGYGRRNAFDSAVEMMRWMRDNSVGVAEAAEGKIVIGELLERSKPEFCQAYSDVVKKAAQAKASRSGLAVGKRPARAPMKEKYEVRLSGSGGQGVILAGVILAEAALIDGLEAVQNQSYGPEARGGASRSEVIIWDQPVDFPEVSTPHLVVCMTEEAWEKYAARVRPGGIVIADSTFVRGKAEAENVFFLPITAETKEATGSALGANVAALGVVAALSGVVSREALEEAVKRRVPARFLESNLKALAIGYAMGLRRASHPA